MRRFSFRSPIKAKPKQNKHIGAKPLALFGRRASRTPSLDELASPGPLPSESMASEVSAHYEDNDAEEEEDERERLRRAKARAFLRAAEPVPHEQHGGHEAHEGVDGSEAEYSPREFGDGEDDEDENDDELGEGVDGELTTDVAELQRQVRGLLLSRVAADDAWREENSRLREQLAAADSREAELQGRLQQLEQRLKASAAASDPTKPTPRERELLRLLVRIVGKEQIRVLLTPPQSSSSTQRTPAQLRRQLVTRAAASSHRRPLNAASSAPSTSGAHAHSSPKKPKPAPGAAASQPVALGTTTTTPPAPLLLSGTRKHEMSDAM